MAGPKLKKFPKFIGSRPYTDIKIEKSTEKTRISLGESQAASRKKEPTTGIPPRLWAHLIPPVPVVTSTVYRHYAKGPPAKSWSLSFDLAVAIMADFLRRSSSKTVEDLQALSTQKGMPIPSDTLRRKVYITQDYREKAGSILDKLFTEDNERVIGWDWRSDRERVDCLKSEWLENIKHSQQEKPRGRTILYLHGGAYYLGSFGLYRQLLAKLAKLSDARVFAIDYRLAPQHPFPAAVEDALAAYLYLTEPPEGIEPVDPSNLVIAGDSAGGGLTFALLLALRDAKLTAPAGAMTLSPWVDLTHSFPSIVDNILTDYLPAAGFKHANSAALDYTLLPRQPIHDEPCNTEIVDDDMERIQFYAPNKALKHPFVSPVFDKKRLRGLPALLVQTGTAERLHDEAVYTALQASNQFKDDAVTEYPATSVRLELYIDQPHVFQLILPTRSATRSLKNLAKFVRDVTTDNNGERQESSGLIVNTISPKGNVSDTTQELLQSFADGKRWTEWQERLACNSLKKRWDAVTDAVAKLDLGSTTETDVNRIL